MLDKIKEELLISEYGVGIEKDILIVVHNQLSYLKKCISSIYKNTKKFNLHIWDNASDYDTKKYLKDLSNKKNNINLYESSENLGFIIPNNRMAEKTKSPYVILLNSDTVVFKYWADVLVGFLEKEKETKIIGYYGGILNKNFLGFKFLSGEEIDYVCGYCMCFSNETYKQFGLFDENNLEFAYGEDADFCLRVKEAGKKIYALYSKDLVFHFCNKTTSSVLIKNDFTPIIKKNYDFLAKKWEKYLNQKK